MITLRTFCDVHGVRLIEAPETHTYKRPWLYSPDLKAAVVFKDATEESIALLIKTIIEQEQIEIGGVA